MIHANSPIPTASISPRNTTVASFSDSSKIWMMSLPLASLALFYSKPSLLVALNLATTLMFAMMWMVQSAVSNFENDKIFSKKQEFCTLLGAAQFSCLIWIAILAGQMMYAHSAWAAFVCTFVTLAVAVGVELIVSTLFLLASQRGNGTSGVSVAALISSKYAGLFGKTI